MLCDLPLSQRKKVYQLNLLLAHRHKTRYFIITARGANVPMMCALVYLEVHRGG